MKTLSSCISVVALVLGLAACGGSDDDDNGGGVDGGNPNNMAPTASFTANPDCTNSAADNLVFTSTSSDPDGDTLTCSWMFASGNPSTSTECTVNDVSFPNQAPYNVTLQVNDGNGGTDMTSMFIEPC